MKVFGGRKSDVTVTEMLVDEKFYIPRIPVSVIAVGETSEALLVRAALESLGATVLLHLVGVPEDFLSIIEQGEAAPRYIVICGHGDEGGIIFGEFGADINTSTLEQGSMPPTVIAGRMNLPGRTVVSTACGTGSKAFGDNLLKGGIAAYIAPDCYPDGAAAGMFIHLLFDQLLRKGRSPASALRHIQKYDEEYAVFSLFTASDEREPGRTRHAGS